MILCISAVSVVTSPFSFLVLLFWDFPFSSWWAWLMVYQFCLSSQRVSFSFIDFCYRFLHFFFIYFWSDFFFLWYVGLSLLWPLPLRSTGSRRSGSAAMAHGPSHSAACGIFPDRGTNPCPLHRQAHSQPLRHQGSPSDLIFMISFLLLTLWVFLFFFL